MRFVTSELISFQKMQPIQWRSSSKGLDQKPISITHS